MILPSVTFTSVWPDSGIAVAGLRVRERPQLVEGVQVRAGQAERLALVEIPPHPDVPVREREHRLRPRERSRGRSASRAPTTARRRSRAGRSSSSSSSPRSATTRSAPAWRSASAWPVRSTPTTKPKPPARPAATPASASSKTAASAGSTSSARAAARNVSGAGLPRRLLGRGASQRRSAPRTGRPDPAASRAARQLALRRRPRRRRPASRTARTIAHRALVRARRPRGAISSEHERVLAVGRAADDRRGVGRSIPRAARKARRRRSAAARRRSARSPRPESNGTNGSPAYGRRARAGRRRTSPSTPPRAARRLRQHAVEVEQAGPDPLRKAQWAQGLETESHLGLFIVSLAHVSSVGSLGPLDHQ